MICEIESNRKRHRIQLVGDFVVGNTIGRGSSAKVKRAWQKTKSDRQYACKIIKRKLEKSISDMPLLLEMSDIYCNPKADGKITGRPSKKSLDSAYAGGIAFELASSFLFDHENIVNLHKVIITPKNYYLFMDFIHGTTLLDYVVSHGVQSSDKNARNIMKQILAAISYLHAHSIVHRDLKIENIMIGRNGKVKLIDFGLANFYSSSTLMDTFCGSLYFASPELLNSKPYYGPHVDVWSLGVILYVLLCGSVPFDDLNLAKLHEKIKAGHVNFPNHLSNDAKHLISRMLDIDPQRRATLSEIAKHPWFKKEVLLYNPPPRCCLHFIDDAVISRMNGFGFGTPQDIKKRLCQALENENNRENSQGNPPLDPIISIYYLVEAKLNKMGGKNDDQSIISTVSSSEASNLTLTSASPSRTELKRIHCHTHQQNPVPDHQAKPKSKSIALKIVSKVKRIFKGKKSTPPPLSPMMSSSSAFESDCYTPRTLHSGSETA